MNSNNHLSTLLDEVQKVCEKVAHYRIASISNRPQLERDLSTIRGNLYLAEMKIDQALDSLYELQQHKSVR